MELFLILRSRSVDRKIAADTLNRVAAKVHALGRAIAAYRAAVDMSLMEMSVKVGVGVCPLWNLERGLAYPTIQTLQILARFFDWSIEDVGRFVLECETIRAGPVSARQRRQKAAQVAAEGAGKLQQP